MGWVGQVARFQQIGVTNGYDGFRHEGHRQHARNGLVRTTNGHVVESLFKINRGCGGGQFDFHRATPSLKGRYARNEPTHGEGRRGTDAKRGWFSLLLQLHGCDGNAVKGWRHGGQKCTTCVSEAELRLGSVKQGATQPGFQSGHLFADRAMRDKKFFGGLGKANVACRSFKSTHSIHGWKFSHARILHKV